MIGYFAKFLAYILSFISGDVFFSPELAPIKRQIKVCEVALKFADPRPQVETAALECLKKEQTPFVVKVAAVVDKGLVQVTEMKNFGNFLPQNTAACLLKSLHQTSAKTRSSGLGIEPNVPGVEIEFSRVQKDASIHSQVTSFCGTPSAKTEHREEGEFRDFVTRVGAPAEEDEHYQKVEACSPHLPETLKSQTLIGKLTVHSLGAGEDGVQKLDKVEAQIQGAEAYAQCLSKTLLEQLQPPLPNIRVSFDGSKPSRASLPTTSYEWFIRQVKDGKVRIFIFNQSRQD